MIAKHANDRPDAEFGVLDEAMTSRFTDTATPLMGTPAAVAAGVTVAAAAFGAGYAAGYANGGHQPIKPSV